MSDDEDAPPPLISLPEQLEAVKLREQGVPASTWSQKAEGLSIASTVIIQPGGSTSVNKAHKPVIKKGFFDSKPAKSIPEGTGASGSTRSDIPMLVGKKQGTAGGPAKVPEFMLVEPDEQEKKYAQMKKELVSALKPTAESVAQIAQDPELLAGFDDPEVMAAVSDIAQNPKNALKYKDNKKVAAFYAAMGKFAGSKLENMRGAPPKQ